MGNVGSKSWIIKGQGKISLDTCRLDFEIQQSKLNNTKYTRDLLHQIVYVFVPKNPPTNMDYVGRLSLHQDGRDRYKDGKVNKVIKVVYMAPRKSLFWETKDKVVIETRHSNANDLPRSSRPRTDSSAEPLLSSHILGVIQSQEEISMSWMDKSNVPTFRISLRLPENGNAEVELLWPKKAVSPNFVCQLQSRNHERTPVVNVRPCPIRSSLIEGMAIIANQTKIKHLIDNNLKI